MVTVLFTCQKCGLSKAKAFVRFRKKDEKIEEYVAEVAFQVQQVHSLLSRECKERKADIYLPVQIDGIGGKARSLTTDEMKELAEKSGIPHKTEPSS